MRQLITFLISTIAIWNVLLAAAPTTDQHMQDYYLGLAVGECFAAGCQIFRGTLLTYPPKPGDNVDVHVEEVLLGPPLTEDTVELPYQDLAPRKYQTGVAYAWGRVKPAANLPIVAVLATNERYGPPPGEPVVVTATDHEAEVIRAIVADALVLQAVPERVSDLVAFLHQSPNAGVSGFLRVYLYRHNFHDAELPSSLLLQMVEDSDIPASQARSVLVDATAPCSLLAPVAKASFLRRLAKLALSPDADLSAAVFERLGKITTFDHSVNSILPPETLDQLRRSYVGLLKSGKIKSNVSLETVLEMQPQ